MATRVMMVKPATSQRFQGGFSAGGGGEVGASGAAAGGVSGISGMWLSGVDTGIFRHACFNVHESIGARQLRTFTGAIAPQ
jgi:hypothetical protein